MDLLMFKATPLPFIIGLANQIKIFSGSEILMNRKEILDQSVFTKCVQIIIWHGNHQRLPTCWSGTCENWVTLKPLLIETTQRKKTQVLGGGFYTMRREKINLHLQQAYGKYWYWCKNEGQHRRLLCPSWPHSNLLHFTVKIPICLLLAQSSCVFVFPLISYIVFVSFRQLVALSLPQLAGHVSLICSVTESGPFPYSAAFLMPLCRCQRR